MRWLRLPLALVAALAIAWSSVSDNPAVCPDDVSDAGEHGHGVPAGHHCCCLSGPCHTPTVLRTTTAFIALVDASKAYASVTPVAPRSIDRPAPPTPPPTLLA